MDGRPNRRNKAVFSSAESALGNGRPLNLRKTLYEFEMQPRTKKNILVPDGSRSFVLAPKFAY